MVSRTKSLNRSAHPEKRFVSRATTKEPEPPSVDGLRHVDHPRLAGEAGSRRSPWHAVVQLEPNAASARQGLLVYVDPQTENPSATNGAGWSSPTLLSFDVARVLSANHDRPGVVLQCRVSATADSGSPNSTDRPQPEAVKCPMNSRDGNWPKKSAIEAEALQRYHSKPAQLHLARPP